MSANYGKQKAPPCWERLDCEPIGSTIYNKLQDFPQTRESPAAKKLGGDTGKEESVELHEQKMYLTYYVVNWFNKRHHFSKRIPDSLQLMLRL